MAIMSDANRAACFADFMRRLSSERDSLPLSKADLRAAVNAIDQWVSDNAAAFNSAIPLPARTALTASQKARLLLFVVEKRYLTGT